MMNFYVMTLFPDYINSGVGESILGRAVRSGHISVNAVNIRDYTANKHMRCDDYPYGGGAGMVMQAQPVCDCAEAVYEMIRQKSLGTSPCVAECDNVTKEDYRADELPTCAKADPVAEAPDIKRPRIVYLTPQGRQFTQEMAEDYAKEEDLILLCGHYEGIDERALEILGTENVSIGDYVLTGGELPALVMIDCISRLIPGVLGGETSADIETFHDNLLEYPQYTRPEVYKGLSVPPILLSGHHANVEKWRREQSIERTLKMRPDLLEKSNLSKKEQAYLKSLLADLKDISE